MKVVESAQWGGFKLEWELKDMSSDALEEIIRFVLDKSGVDLTEPQAHAINKWLWNRDSTDGR